MADIMGALAAKLVQVSCPVPGQMCDTVEGLVPIMDIGAVAAEVERQAQAVMEVMEVANLMKVVEEADMVEVLSAEPQSVVLGANIMAAKAEPTTRVWGEVPAATAVHGEVPVAMAAAEAEATTVAEVPEETDLN